MPNLRNDEPLIELIRSANWDDLTPRLLAYAAFRLSEYREPASKAPGFVEDAVAEILDGKHVYRGGGLFQFGREVIDKLIARYLDD